MSDMAPLFSFFAMIPVILGGFYIYAHQRTLGTLDITTTSVAYDRTRYQDLLDWDKYSLTIEGEPTQILSGEFHYWRVPDRTRWTPILKQYRSAGFNTIRIYFHWGYHSPSEGNYLFDGNRDIDYLLTLCEELGLFVLAAPGPYICAETQAGGYPGWVVAKRDLNIRHNFMMLWRIYDPKFANYEIQWMDAILPIIAKHQITNGQKGCVLGVQIDNELFETMNGMLPVGLHDQMRILAKAARDAGITVPLFTNDGFEEGGWVARPELDNKKGKKRFGIDLYGFDKYVIFAPSSSPKSWLINSGVSVGDWDEWDPKNMEKSMDKLESKIRSFGGGAKESPIFIPELQGGWFNHYQLQHTYDQIFDFYGEEYTKLLVETSLAQGVTMASIYMIYGGTNWGTLGDPDVYTSYDYSACIREFGMLSSRGRNLRKTLLLTRSFDPYFTKTDRVSHPNVKTSIPHTLNLQRQSIANDQQVTFTFFRNFDRKKRETFDITIEEKEGSLTMGCYLPYKTSFIAVGNYTAENDLHLIMSTIPILSRMVDPINKQEIWVVEPNIIGSMAFRNKEVTITGNMQDDTLRVDGPAIILSFEKDHGWTKIESTTGSLYIIGLSKQDASTLFAEFQEPYWSNGQKKYPALIAWGADNFFYNRQSQVLEVNHRPSETEAHIISLERIMDRRMIESDGVYDLPFIQSFKYEKNINSPLPISISFDKFEHRPVDFKDMPWEHVRRFGRSSPVSFDAIDYQYLSGHVLYRSIFKTPVHEHKVTLSLTARHRATVLMNGKVIGGHTTYSRQLFMPGAKIGPDPWFIGKHTYDLTPYLSYGDYLENELVVIVESFGLNRQAFIMNDIRNPRGITYAKISGVEEANDWQITGVDIRELSNPFISSGFPDEEKTTGFKILDTVHLTDITYKIPISVNDGVQWFRFRFDDELKKHASSYTVPLRLHIQGEWTAMVFINDVLIARYYGNGDGPQHDFYLPDDLIQSKNNQVKILAYTWKDTQGELFIAGWPVLAESGNLITHYEQDHKPAEYMVYKDQIKF